MRKWTRNLRTRLKERKFHRKLEVSKAGGWFLALTIVLGIVALMTGNNVIYLIESFMLAGLVLSGMVSEKAISSLEIRFNRSQGRAEERSSDWIEVTNLSRQSFFSIDIGEWNDGKFSLLTHLPKIRAHETIRVRSAQSFERRGTHRWQGHAISTSGPFAFARKTKVRWKDEGRIIWPARERRRNRRYGEGTSLGTLRRAGSEIVEGEIRPYQVDDDAKLIVARLSAKGTGYYVRNRKQQLTGSEQVLDLRLYSPADLEAAIRIVAQQLEDANDPHLRIIDSSGAKVFKGLRPSMNALAELQPESRNAENSAA